MERQCLLDTILRDQDMCLRLLKTLLNENMRELEYVGRSEQRPGVRVEASASWPAQNYIVDIGIASGMMERDKLEELAVNSIADLPHMDDKKATALVFCLDGIADENRAVIRLPEQESAILNVEYTNEGDTGLETLEFLDALREQIRIKQPKTKLRESLFSAQKASFYPLFMRNIPEWEKRFDTLVSAEAIDVDGVSFYSLRYFLAQKPAMERFLLQLLESDVSLCQEPITSDLWASPMRADIWAEDEVYGSFVVTVQPNNLGLDVLFWMLQGMAARTMESSWDTHAIAICNYDALGVGKCYYRIRPSADGLARDIPSRVVYHILCVPHEGMSRNAPGEVQMMLDHLAGEERPCELLQRLQQNGDKWSHTDKIKAEARQAFIRCLDRAYGDKDFAPPFRLLHALTNAYIEGSVNSLLAHLHALILYFRDIESVERMAEKLKLRPESIQKVLRGRHLEERDLY